MDVNSAFAELWRVFVSVLPYILTGIVIFFVTKLENRTKAEKIRLEAAQTRTDAQELLNKFALDFKAELAASQQARFDDAVKHAEERGSLRTQIDLLQQDLRTERARVNQNDTRIAELQGTLSATMQAEQAAKARIEQLIAERDALDGQLKAVQLERDRLASDFQAELQRLNGRIDTLQAELTAKQDEIQRIEKLIGDPSSNAAVHAEVTT